MSEGRPQFCTTPNVTERAIGLRDNFASLTWSDAYADADGTVDDPCGWLPQIGGRGAACDYIVVQTACPDVVEALYDEWPDELPIGLAADKVLLIG